MEKAYPGNVIGVKHYGVDKWLDDYFMPVTGMECLDIFKDVFCNYTSLLKNSKNERLYWLAVANINTTAYVVHVIFNLLRYSRLKEEGYKCILGQGKEMVPDNLKEFDITAVPGFKSVDSNSFCVRNNVEGIRNVLSMIKNNLPASDRMNRKIIRNISKPYFMIGNKKQPELVNYCELEGISPIYLSPMIFAKKTKNIALCPITAEINDFIDEFLLHVRSKYPIVEPIYEKLNKTIKEYFLVSCSYFIRTSVLLKKFELGTLLVTGLGIGIHRSFCSVWKYLGGEVVGLAHGNPYCDSYIPFADIRHFLLVDKYVASTKGEAEILRKLAQDFPVRLKMADITYARKSIHFPLFEKLQQAESVSKVKRIMLIGFNMVNAFMSFALPEHHTLAFLHLEIRLLKLLRSSGYYVIYKVHPDTAKHSEELFKPYADEIVSERFEEVYSKADCFLFCRSNTSPFGFSLLTNKPIVLLNNKEKLWFQKAFQLLRKRCSIVEVEADGKGRILFDDQEVLDAIKSSLHKNNYDVVKEFAF